MLGLLEGLRAVGEREGAPDIAGAVGRRLHEPPAR
jgi:hypothetical protein